VGDGRVQVVHFATAVARLHIAKEAINSTVQLVCVSPATLSSLGLKRGSVGLEVGRKHTTGSCWGGLSASLGQVEGGHDGRAPRGGVCAQAWAQAPLLPSFPQLLRLAALSLEDVRMRKAGRRSRRRRRRQPQAGWPPTAQFGRQVSGLGGSCSCRAGNRVPAQGRGAWTGH